MNKRDKALMKDFAVALLLDAHAKQRKFGKYIVYDGKETDSIGILHEVLYSTRREAVANAGHAYREVQEAFGISARKLWRINDTASSFEEVAMKLWAN